MEIFDREPELAQLAAALERVSRGDGLVIALLGEAGIGKSSLARKFVEPLDQNVRVLRGYCDDLGIAEPLGVLRDLAREAEIDLAEDLVEPGNRLRAFSKVFEGFFGADTPTIILVEDVHWADDATVDFLRFLTRRVAGTRLMLVLTARSDGALGRNKVRRIMGDAISHDAIRLELGPLSQETIVRLANKAGVNADQLSELTGGNAFFVTELLNSQDGSRSESVEESVLLRADRLEASLREVLDTASVFPRQVDVAHLSTLLGRDLDQALLSIADEGFLVSVHEAFEFRHVLVRQAINAAIPPTRRREINDQLLRMLKAEGCASASRLLYHAREAGDDAEVTELAVKAASEAVNIGARREARDLYCLAVEMHGTHASAELLEEAAHACHLVGADADSIEFQNRALEIHDRCGDKTKFGNALRLRSRFHWSAGAFEASWQDAKGAVDCLLGIRGPELAMAQSNAAQVHMLNREYRLVQQPAEAAIEIAEELGLSDVLSHALNNLACALMFDDPKRARNGMNRSLQLALEDGHVEHAARAFVNATYIEIYLCQYDAAKAYATRGIFYCKSQELDAYLAYLTGALALAELGLGEFEAAEQNASEAIALAKSFDLGINRHSGSVAFLRHQVRTGAPLDQDEIAYLESFRADATEVQRLIPYAECLAEYAWMSGDRFDDAIKLLSQAINLAPTAEIAQTAHVWLKRLKPDHQTPSFEGFLDCYHLEMTGDFAKADQSWSDLMAPYDHALCLAHGDQTMRSRAAEMFDSLGASVAARRVRASLVRTGVQPSYRPRTSTLGNPAGLTNRQMDVLRCLQDGLSNAAIADRLFISAKTVDHHVSAILAKLDVKTRAEAASLANKGGLGN